jgi:hypothetical protein
MLLLAGGAGARGCLVAAAAGLRLRWRRRGGWGGRAQGGLLVGGGAGLAHGRQPGCEHSQTRGDHGCMMAGQAHLQPGGRLRSGSAVVAERQHRVCAGAVVPAQQAGLMPTDLQGLDAPALLELLDGCPPNSQVVTQQGCRGRAAAAAAAAVLAASARACAAPRESICDTCAPAQRLGQASPFALLAKESMATARAHGGAAVRAVVRGIRSHRGQAPALGVPQLIVWIRILLARAARGLAGLPARQLCALAEARGHRACATRKSLLVPQRALCAPPRHPTLRCDLRATRSRSCDHTVACIALSTACRHLCGGSSPHPGRGSRVACSAAAGAWRAICLQPESRPDPRRRRARPQRGRRSSVTPAPKPALPAAAVPPRTPLRAGAASVAVAGGAAACLCCPAWRMTFA